MSSTLRNVQQQIKINSIKQIKLSKMDAKIKNTLFRFVTFRKPEQIDEDKKLNLFVNHPAPTQSALYASTATEFNTKLDTFVAKTKDQIIAIKPDLYKLGLWVIQNRDSVTPVSFQTKMAELGVSSADTLTGIDTTPSEEIVIWDNFIYQIAKHAPDQSALDAAMTLLYANYLLKQQTIQDTLSALTPSSSSFTSTGGGTSTDPMMPAMQDKAFKRALQARIVRPAFMTFTAASTSNPASAASAVRLNARKSLGNAIQFVENLNSIESLTSLKKELVLSQNKYQKLEAINLKTYEAEYNAAYTAYLNNLNNASNSLTGDGSATPPAAPVYNYVALEELNAERMENELTEANLELYNSIKTDEILTYAELIQKIDTTITELNNQNANAATTAITYRQIGSANIQIPVNNPADNYTYSIKSVKTNNKYKFILSVQFPDDSTTIDLIDAKVSVGTNLIAETTEEYFENVMGKCTGTLFFTSPVSFASGTTTVKLDIEFTTNTGNRFAIHQDVKLNQTYSYGILEIGASGGSTGGSGGTSDPGIPGGNAGSSDTDDTNTPMYKKYGVTRLGIADYRKVEQSICCYVPGEVSHIENIMAREYKERATRRLRRSETTVTTERSTETENLTDTTTTEKNEMHQEISKMTQQSMDFNINAGVHWGKESKGLSAYVDTSFAYHNSKEESNNMSRTEAKDVTERAMERVVSKVREERIQKIIDEFTEENKHGFDNREGTAHVSGVYRWVDKVYKNEIFNYGKRLMYEFMIPQPAKFHTLFTSNVDRKYDLQKPIDPRTVTIANNGIPTFAALDDSNYKIWASAFNAEVEAPPLKEVVFTKSYSATSANKDSRAAWEKSWNDFKIDEGYKITAINCVHEFRRGYADESDINPNSCVQVGPYNKVIQKKSNGFNWDNGYESGQQTFNYSNLIFIPKDQIIPVSVVCWDISSFVLNIQASAKVTDEFMNNWKAQTFNKIIQAYEDKLTQYEQKLAALKAEAAEQVKVNPLFNRSIENTVLRKNCISYIIGYAALGKNFQDDTTGITTHNIKTSSTGTNSISLQNYGSLTKFIEQAFEWEIMSYIFYPFYWGSRDDWSAMYNADAGDDTLFAKFLQSGMARVIVTVRPGFEDAVNWFLETGQVWNGNTSAPVIGDELYLSIVDELQEPEYYVEGSWETRIPSTLTVIQDSGVGLHAEGLPCFCEKEDLDVFSASTATLQGQTNEGVGYWQVNADEGTPIVVPKDQTESK